MAMLPHLALVGMQCPCQKCSRKPMEYATSQETGGHPNQKCDNYDALKDEIVNTTTVRVTTVCSMYGVCSSLLMECR